MQQNEHPYDLFLRYNAEKLSKVSLRCRAKRIVSVLLCTVMLVLCGNVVHRYVQYRTAKEFLDTLYTVTDEDCADPKMRVERLLKLADEALVNALVHGDAFPAVYLHEQERTFTAEIKQRGGFELFGNDEIIMISGMVLLTDTQTGEEHSFSPSPAFYLYIEDGKITDLYAPSLRWKDAIMSE